jgi:BirA family biotin operon repressor/biotin-[acetyl-CoA-carboxylase] ligase
VPGDRARSELSSTQFADVRWVAETGSTNEDVLDLARHGEGEGLVLVADHQTAGRGRAGRTWEAPSGASLLLSVLLRPPGEILHLATTAMGVAAVDALLDTAGVKADLKWPNDVVAQDGGAERKLAGILAEADWPAGSSMSAGYRAPAPTERTTVVVGIGINVNWPAQLPAALAETAVSANHLAGREIDREELLIALLRRLDGIYGPLVASGDPEPLLSDWRSRSATLGRRVRVELGAEDVVGTAVDITSEGHLLVDTLEGTRRTFAAGDVVHLRPT